MDKEDLTTMRLMHAVRAKPPWQCGSLHFLLSVANFIYLRATVTHQNHIHGEDIRKLKSGNACCQLVQNLLPYAV
jgi:hypothetical protein